MLVYARSVLACISVPQATYFSLLSGPQCCHHCHCGMRELSSLHDRPGRLPHSCRSPTQPERPGERQGERDGLGRLCPHHHSQPDGGTHGIIPSQLTLNIFLKALQVKSYRDVNLSLCMANNAKCYYCPLVVNSSTPAVLIKLCNLISNKEFSNPYPCLYY